MEKRDKLMEFVQKIFPTASNYAPDKYMNSFRITLGGRRFRISAPHYSRAGCFVEEVCGAMLKCNGASKLLENIINTETRP